MYYIVSTIDLDVGGGENYYHYIISIHYCQYCHYIISIHYSLFGEGGETPLHIDHDPLLATCISYQYPLFTTCHISVSTIHYVSVISIHYWLHITYQYPLLEGKMRLLSKSITIHYSLHITYQLSQAILGVGNRY